MDLPAGPVQDYIRLAGICAIYVASSPSGACQVGVTRDLKRTQTILRRQGQDSTYVVTAFWTDDGKLATKIAGKINKAGDRACLTEAEVIARIGATAADMRLHFTEHAAVMQRVELAVSHVRDTLEQAQRNGGLKWFNEAFHAFRLRAKTCGHPPMSYGQARTRLRRVVVRRMLLGQRSGLGAEILPEVFPELPG